MFQRLVLPAAIVAALLTSACETTPSSTAANKPMTPEKALYIKALAMQTSNTQMLDLPGAKDALEKAAAAGSAEAADRLGDMYRLGDGGIAKDMAKSFEWYQKEAAMRNGAWGLVRVGEFHEYGLGGQSESSLDADEWYKKAVATAQTGATAGDASAMTALGYLLSNGRGLKEDDTRAWEWEIRASEIDKARAMDVMAHFYATGQGIEPDLGKAFKSALTAAQLGVTEDMVDVSLGFMNGVGAPVDPVAAMEWMQRAVDRGNSRAMREMGNYYHNGQGVQRNDEQARMWYQKSIDLNNEVAMGLMGQLVAQKDPQEALTWYKRGEAAKDPGSMYWEAMLYLNPPQESSIVRDTATAIQLLQSSAAGNYGRAMTRLGQLAQNANNPSEALRQYRRAAQVGDTEGMYRLAFLLTGRLDNVEHTPEQYPEAKTWLTKSAEGGWGPAMTALGQIYSNGVGRENKDLEPFLGAKWFEKGAKAGEAESMREYGEILVVGKYASRDLKAAQDLFNKAVALGDTAAIVDLGIMYEKGQGVEQNYQRAMQYYLDADSKREITAKAAIAHLYQDGLGVKADPQLAISLLQQGIQQGDVGAMLALAQTYEFGKGILIDNVKARQYYMMARNAGSDDAQTWLDFHPDFITIPSSNAHSAPASGAPGNMLPPTIPGNRGGPGGGGRGGRGPGG